MDTWQLADLLYPDAELVACEATRRLEIPGVAYVGTALPANPTIAVVWNRVGGRDPAPLMQVRVWAPTVYEAVTTARLLAARLPLAVTFGLGITRVWQNEGPTDLGATPISEPMRQMMYEFGLQPQLEKAVSDE